MKYFVEWQDEDCSDECFPYTTKAFETLEAARDWRDMMNPTGITTRIVGYDASTNGWEILEMD